MNAIKKIFHLNDSSAKKKEEKKSPPSLQIVNGGGLSSDRSSDTQHEKMEYEKFKKLIAEKIKDPKMAQKAALIITDMINKKP